MTWLFIVEVLQCKKQKQTELNLKLGLNFGLGYLARDLFSPARQAVYRLTAAAPAPAPAAAVPATAAAEAAGEPLPSVCGAAAPAHNNIPNTHSHIAAHATTISHNYPSADPTGCAQHTPECVLCVLHAMI